MYKSHTHKHPFNGLLSGTIQVSRYQKGKTNLDFTEARDSEWQWHQLGHMQVCTSLQTHNHASTPPLCLLQAGCPSCRPTNSVKALKANLCTNQCIKNYLQPHFSLAKAVFKSHVLCTSVNIVCPGCPSSVSHDISSVLRTIFCRLKPPPK